MKDTSLIASILSNGSTFRAARQMMLVLPVFALTVVGKAQAQTQTWDPGSTPGTGSDGSGTWNATNTNWATSGSDAVWGGSANNAVFGVGGTAGTITVTGTQTASNLTINATTGNYIFTGG